MGTTQIKMSYNAKGNGMVERHHRQLKAAIRCHQNNIWTDVLPTILMSIRAAWKDDLNATSAELAYGETIRIPRRIFRFTHRWNSNSRYFRPAPQLAAVKRHSERKTFIFKTSKHRDNKIFVVKVKELYRTITINLEPAFILSLADIQDGKRCRCRRLKNFWHLLHLSHWSSS